jgi:N12 class adenine-specific DNA methylase
MARVIVHGTNFSDRKKAVPVLELTLQDLTDAARRMFGLKRPAGERAPAPTAPAADLFSQFAEPKPGDRVMREAGDDTLLGEVTKGKSGELRVTKIVSRSGKTVKAKTERLTDAWTVTSGPAAPAAKAPVSQPTVTAKSPSGRKWARPKVFFGETTGKNVERLKQRGWGRVWMTPGRTIGVYPGEEWILDNAAFRQHSAQQRWDAAPTDDERPELDTDDLYTVLDGAMVRVAKGEIPPPMFAVIPDVPMDGPGSIEAAVYFIRQERPLIEDKYNDVFPWYLAVQDGMTPADLERTMVDGKPLASLIDGIFLGGSNPWKMQTAPEWAAFAKKWNLPWHYARAGTKGKLMQAAELGADSIDTAFLQRYPKEWTKFEAWWDALHDPAKGPQAELPFDEIEESDFNEMGGPPADGMARLTLTSDEQMWFAWAMDPASDFFASDEAPIRHASIGRAEEGTVLATPEVLNDLLYRLEEQGADMLDEEMKGAKPKEKEALRKSQLALRRVAKKLRDLLPSAPAAAEKPMVEWTDAEWDAYQKRGEKPGATAAPAAAAPAPETPATTEVSDLDRAVAEAEAFVQANQPPERATSRTKKAKAPAPAPAPTSAPTTDGRSLAQLEERIATLKRWLTEAEDALDLGLDDTTGPEVRANAKQWKAELKEVADLPKAEGKVADAIRKRAEEARARLSQKKLYSGIDPELVADYTAIGVELILDGYLSFKDFAGKLAEAAGQVLDDALAKLIYVSSVNEYKRMLAEPEETVANVGRTVEGEPAAARAGTPDGAGAEGAVAGSPDGDRAAGGRAVPDPVRAPEAAAPAPRAGSPRPGERGEGAGADGAGVRPGRAAGEPKRARRPAEPAAQPVAPKVDFNLPAHAKEVAPATGPVARFNQNVAALKLLRTLAAENRPATADEQLVLAQFSGWGALAPVFSEQPGEWAKRQAELKELLTEAEYAAARASTLNAHYTSLEIVKAMVEALPRFGLSGGRVLEPSAGTGNFIGWLTSDPRFRLTGVELDPVTGRILKALYPNAESFITGFEKAVLPPNEFDAVISNVPFGDYQLSDPRYDRHKLLIHDYFIVRALDLARPGGLVMVITSKGTLDKQSQAARKLMAERGWFVGAVRLPNTAFKGNAGTEVTTDILVFRKKLPGELKPSWAQSFLATPDAPMGTGYYDRAPMNEYFHAHPSMLLGKMELGQGLYSKREAQLVPLTGMESGEGLAKVLDAALAQLGGDIVTPRTIDTPATRQEAETGGFEIPADDPRKDGALFVKGGVVLQRQGAKAERFKVAATQVEKVKALVEIKELVRSQFSLELRDAPEAEIEANRKLLKKAYDAFRKKYGAVTKQDTSSRLDKDGDEVVTVKTPNIVELAKSGDPDWSLILLDEYDEANDTVTEMPILTQRIITPRARMEIADSPVDALAMVLEEEGRVSIPDIAARSRVTEGEAQQALAGLIYRDPATGRWEPANLYLSGNVREKLALARSAAAEDATYQANVVALEAIQPADLPPSLIGVELGSTWIPVSYVRDFVRALAQTYVNESDFNPIYIPSIGEWTIEVASWLSYRPFANSEYGTKARNLFDLLDAAMNGKRVEVTKEDDSGNRVTDMQATEEANAKLELLKQKWRTWVWENAERADVLVRLYNDQFNSRVLPSFDGGHLTLPGAAGRVRGRAFTPFAHQRDAVWRIVQTGNTLLAHEVGTGKTWTMAMAAMELRRLGLARKPVITFPKALLTQWAREFRELYPTAKLLVPGPDDFTPQEREAFISRMAMGDWDAVLLTHEQLARIPMDAERVQAQYAEEIASLLAAEEEMRQAHGKKSRPVKRIEAARKRLEKKLEDYLKKKRDGGITFEETGADFLFVDEAHYFKNLYVRSFKEGVGPSSEAGRAFDMLLRTRYLNEKTGQRGVVFATGTPIANNLAELHTVMRYLQPDVLRSLGMEHFDPWAKQFAVETSEYEASPTGKGFKRKERLRTFINVADLLQLTHQQWDVVKAKDTSIERPPMIGGKPEVVVVPASRGMKRFMKVIVQRAEAIKAKKVDPTEDNFLKITVDARHAALDLRLVDADTAPTESNKATAVSTRVADIYAETTPLKGTQLVLVDLSAPDSDPSEKRGGLPGWNIYAQITKQLVAAGVPEAEIAWIHDAKDDAARRNLFRKIRAGTIRVLLASRSKVGVGVNIQDRLVALHNVDVPWRPDWLEQGNGRILRQGNLLYNTKKIPGIRIFNYVSEGSFDTFMWQKVESKARTIHSFMDADLSVREVANVDETVLNYAEVKAVASGNPKLMEQAKLDDDVRRLRTLARAHVDSQHSLRQRIRELPSRIEAADLAAEQAQEDVVRVEDTSGDKFKVTVNGTEYTKRPEAGQAIRSMLSSTFWPRVMADKPLAASVWMDVGTFQGFKVRVQGIPTVAVPKGVLQLIGRGTYEREIEPGDSIQSIIAKLEAMPEGIQKRGEDAAKAAAEYKVRLGEAERLVGTAFEKQAELEEKAAKLDQLNKELEEAARQEEERAFIEDDVDEDMEFPEEPETGGDGVTLGIGLGGAQRLFARKQGAADFTPVVTATTKEVEEALIAARKGPPKATLSERMKAKLRAFKAGFRHFPNIDTDSSPLAAMVHELLLQVEYGRAYAERAAYEEVRRVVEGLTPPQADLMTRILALRDQVRMIEETTLYDPDDKPMPFYGQLPKSDQEKALRADLAKFEAAAKADPKLMRALARRQRLVAQTSYQLFKAGLLSKEQAKDGRYYHRMVLMHYLNAQPDGLDGKAIRDMHKRSKPFLFKRTGGDDFSLRYTEAEGEWLVQALQTLQLHRALDRIKAMGDLRPTLIAQYNALLPAGQPQADGRSSPDTFAELIPDDHVVWQPKEGNRFYRALMIEDDWIQKLAGGDTPTTWEGMAKGGMLEWWVIPDWLAATLDYPWHEREDRLLGRLMQRVTSLWKQWTLYAPWRLTKYLLNNQAGDFDASLLAPRLLKEAPQAEKDLRAFYFGGRMPTPLRKELERASELRVVGTGQTLAEFPDINTLPGLEGLYADTQQGFMRWLASLPRRYWRFAPLINQYRESIFRLAAWRALQKAEAAGAKYYLGSRREVVDQLRAAGMAPDEIAAKLSNDLFGDYGNVSEHGVFVSDHLIPFFRWKEVNAKRYWNLFRNAPVEGGSRGRVLAAAGAAVGRGAVGGVVRVGVGMGMALTLANLFMAAVQLWNAMFFPDEEDELRRRQKGMFLIVGRTKDGKLMRVRVDGAFADWLKWVDLNNWPDDVKDLRGTKTVADQMKETLWAPVNEIAQGLGPWRTFIEATLKRSAYPSIQRPHTVRDPIGHVANALSLGWLWDRISNKPVRPGSLNPLVGYVDLGEANYFYVKQKAADFAAKQGRVRGGGDPTPRSNALYYWKRSLEIGDTTKAQYWIRKYFELGGRPDGIKASMRLDAPLAGLPTALRGPFLASLSREEQNMYRDAELWYRTRLSPEAKAKVFAPK